MPNNIEPESAVTQEKVPGKNFPFKILILLLVLSVIGALVFVFKDRVFDLIPFLKEEPEVVEEVTKPSGSGESPFGGIVEEENNYSDEVNEYLDQYEYYGMGIQGRPYKFVRYEDGKISLENLVGDDPEEIVSYPLSDDYVIVCTKFDVANVFIDLSRYSDMDKFNVAKKVISVSSEKKETLLENYPEGSGAGVTFNSDGNSIIKLMLTFSEPEECYR